MHCVYATAAARWSGSSWLYGDHVLRLSIVHQLRHSVRMGSVYMTVSVQNQLTAVFVALPLGDDFHVYAALDRASDEHPPE